jgi:hypothetical protein
MAKRSLNIKNLVPRKNGTYRQGYYNLLNPQKYIGDPHKIIFRSSWERRFAIYCDTNERILSWSSEPLQIPYLNPVDREIRPYNVDFYVKIKTEKGYSEYIVEVKPAKQLKAPQAPKGRITEKAMNAYTSQLQTYLINTAKFSAAKEYAKGRGWQFVIVTESMLFG